MSVSNGHELSNGPVNTTEMTSATQRLRRSIDIFRHRRRSTWLIDALLFAVFVADGVPLPFVPISVPPPEFAMIILIAFSILRGPRIVNLQMGGYALGLTLLLLFLSLESEFNGVDWTRRLVRIALLGIFVWVIASGRVDIRSGLIGLLMGLAVNIPLYYAGVAPDNYAGFLTGYLGDKNVAGMYYSLIPTLMLLIANKRWQKFALVAFAVVATFLTGSRTSLGALACALIWLVFARKFGPILRAILAVVLINLLGFVEERFSQVWIFEDRTGTDALRARIDAASLEKLNAATWYGDGLGTATVHMDDRFFFFHNAYWGLLVEGGWIFLGFVIFAFIWIGLNPLRGRVRSKYSIYIEASVIILLTCATRLGEVFITVPAAIVLGCAFAARNLQNQR